MTNSITVRIGTENLTEEKFKTPRSFFETMKMWFESSGGYDFLSTLKKVSILLGNDRLIKQANGYIAGTSIPRAYVTTYTLYKTCQAYRTNPAPNLQCKVDLIHQVFDCSAMISYMTAFFRKTPTPSVNAGIALGCMSDATDAISSGIQAWNGLKRHSKLSMTDIRFQQANSNTTLNAFLKLIKAVTAVVVGFFACFTLITGIALLSSTPATIIALVSSFFSIATYYHKNYWCDSFLKAEQLTNVSAL